MNVVLVLAAIMSELQDGRELYGRVVKGDYPDSKYLRDLDVENEVCFVKRFNDSISHTVSAC